MVADCSKLVVVAAMLPPVTPETKSPPPTATRFAGVPSDPGFEPSRLHTFVSNLLVQGLIEVWTIGRYA